MQNMVDKKILKSERIHLRWSFDEAETTLNPDVLRPQFCEKYHSLTHSLDMLAKFSIKY